MNYCLDFREKIAHFLWLIRFFLTFLSVSTGVKAWMLNFRHTKRSLFMWVMSICHLLVKLINKSKWTTNYLTRLKLQISTMSLKSRTGIFKWKSNRPCSMGRHSTHPFHQIMQLHWFSRTSTWKVKYAHCYNKSAISQEHTSSIKTDYLAFFGFGSQS